MAAIKGKDTKPELIVRKYLFSRGLRYRIQDRRLPGRPDIVLPKYKTVVFVDGCFWHGHDGCRYFRLPQSNVEFWQTKIERNKARDTRNEEELRTTGWHVIRVWECEIRKVAGRQEYLDGLYRQIVGDLGQEEKERNKPIPYSVPEEVEIGIAAEEEEVYG